MTMIEEDFSYVSVEEEDERELPSNTHTHTHMLFELCVNFTNYTFWVRTKRPTPTLENIIVSDHSFGTNTARKLP